MHSRRRFIFGAASAAVALSTGRAEALTKKEANLKHPYQSGQTSCLAESRVDWSKHSTGPQPSSQNLELAKNFLSSMSSSNTPYDVALEISKSEKKGSHGELFRRRWRAESNPAISWYFAFTDEAPCNDMQLDWCAAFASWALVCSGRRRLPYADVQGNISALKKYAYGNNLDARVGDLVFLSRQGGGHVGFFSRWDGDAGIYLVGGNQREEDGIGSSAVCEQRISLSKGSPRKLASIIPIDAFKKVGRDQPTPKIHGDVGHLIYDEKIGPWPTVE